MESDEYISGHQKEVGCREHWNSVSEGLGYG